jgi:hypothetical protein
VKSQPIGHFRIANQPVELAIDERQRLVLYGMGVLEAGHEQTKHRG